MMTNLFRVSLVPALLVGLTLSACGDHHHDDDAAEDACYHFANGPSLAVTAASEAASAPDATADHTRVDVTLVDLGDGTFGGFITLSVGDAGDLIVFANRAVTLAVTNDQGAAVTPEATEIGSEVCGDIAVAYTYDLAVGTYLIEVTPTSEATVSFVYVEPGDHSH